MYDELIQCTKCDREATFDSPENFCDLHHMLWWTEDWGENITAEELTADRIQILEETWADCERPDDAQSQIEEVRKL